jgi:hypothetical protein
MKQTTKNIILVIIWTLSLGLLSFIQMERQKELWERLLLITLVVITALLYIKNVSRIKYYTLIDDVLIIRQTFSKEKHYSLKNVKAWTENQYHLFEFKTGKEIVLKMNEGTKMNLFKKNSKDFEKLSDYLNENIPDGYEE